MKKYILAAAMALTLATSSYAQEQKPEAPATVTVESVVASDVVKQELIGWLKSLRSTVETGAAFAGEQVPLILQEKVAYGRAISTTWALLFLIIYSIGAYHTPIALRWGWRLADKSEGFSLFITALLSLAFHGFVGTLVISGLDDAFKVWFAPRLYIVEWLVSLTK